jgi:hypothetical protein
VIPERHPPHVVNNLLVLREHEIIHPDLPSLCYLIRMQIVEYQDWHTPSTSYDEGYGGGGGDDSDSGDSNFNGYHLGIDDVGSCSTMPHTFRFTLADNGRGGGPSLGLGSGPMFRSRSPWPSVLVGAISCPLVPISHGPMRAGVVIGGPLEIPDVAWRHP